VIVVVSLAVVSLNVDAPTTQEGRRKKKVTRVLLANVRP